MTYPGGWPPPPQPIGPPPREPDRPRLRRTNHILHFLLSLFTLGGWVVVWIAVALYTVLRNSAERQQYERAYEQWRDDYIRWQHGGFSPPPPRR